eukprot:2236115-Alexandrium_andersonii.AAC.1
MRKTQKRFTHSNLEPRWPKYRLKTGPEAPEGCAPRFFCADPESAHESEPRGGPRSRNRQVEGSNPQSENP